MADKHKLSYLDGIRGCAAFFVFIHHFLLVFYTACYTFDPRSSHLNNLEIKYGQSVFSFISNGNFCVFIFFVLSGFVLSRKYLRSNHFEILVSGAVRRYLRLFIPVAFTMILAYFMMQAKVFMNVQAAALTHSEWWFSNMWTFDDSFKRLLTCLKTDTMFRVDSTFDTTLWTISIELAGSMFVFAWLALTHGIRNKIIALLAVIVYAKWTNQPFLLTFLLGISLNYIEQYFELHKKSGLTLLAFVLLVPGLILGSYPSNGEVKNTLFAHMPQWLEVYTIYFHAIGAFFVVCAFVISTSLQHIISLLPFRFLGRVSFSLYLLHPLIMGSVSSYLLLKWYQHVSYNRLVPIIFTFTTIVCLLAAWLMTRYIDEPGTRLSKWMYKRWFKAGINEGLPMRKPDLNAYQYKR